MTRRILQIMPAYGVNAEFSLGTDDRQYQLPVIAWALVEDTYANGHTATFVVGMVTREDEAELSMVDQDTEDDTFKRYTKARP